MPIDALILKLTASIYTSIWHGIECHSLEGNKRTWLKMKIFVLCLIEMYESRKWSSPTSDFNAIYNSIEIKYAKIISFNLMCRLEWITWNVYLDSNRIRFKIGCVKFHDVFIHFSVEKRAKQKLWFKNMRWFDTTGTKICEKSCFM